MAKSDEIAARQARYNRVERVTDASGRQIGVKMLKPSQRIAVEEMAPNLTGAVEVTIEDDDGKVVTFELPNIARLIFAASVVEIDEAVYPFPKNRAELNAVVDVLDDDGMAAVAIGITRLSASEKEGGAMSVKDAAKKSGTTPESDRPSG